MSHSLQGIDLESAFRAVESKILFEYRDPLLSPFGDEERVTPTQRKAWAFLKKWTGLGPMIAMIAAKGAAKTHFGACYAWHQAQAFPESMGCLVSNTIDQAKGTGLPIFYRIAENLSYKAEFFNKVKVKGKPYTDVVVITLAENIFSYMLVRSYEAIKNFEGTEPDWIWSEEGQDTDYDGFTVPFSRNRGRYGDNAYFYAAMPADESHYQYQKLPLLGMVEEKKFKEPDYDAVVQSRETGFKGEPIEVGIMYEFSVYENVKNVGSQYIARNSKAYTGALFDRYVLGERGASDVSRLFPAYNAGIHKLGFMPQFLKGFDKSRDATLILDFNVAPACCSIWQEKPWNDAWAESCYINDDGRLMRIYDAGTDNERTERLHDITLVAPPNRNVYVQVAEVECWEGGTRGMMQMVIDRLDGFTGELYVNGDASGRAMRSSATVSDWDIVRDYLDTAGVRYVMQTGLIVKFSGDGATYSNPSIGDTINLVNLLLRDNTGRVHLVFMPDSEYESGGVAASISEMKVKPDGTWDQTCDRKVGKDVRRTHFTDGVRYYAWYVTGGSILSLTDGYDESLAELLHGRQVARAEEQYGIKRGLDNIPRIEERVKQIHSGNRSGSSRFSM